MKGASDTLCFTCGQPAGDTLRLNHLPGGQVCPTCRDRLLEALPPLLPGGLEEEEGAEPAQDPPRTEAIWGSFPPDTPA